MDTTGPAVKVLFHYVKSSVKYDEWIEYGSPRICKYNSKVPFQEKKVRKKRTTESSKNVLSPAVNMPLGDVPSIRQYPSAASASSREKATEGAAVFEAQDHGSLSSYGIKQIASDAVVVEQPKSLHNPGSASLTFSSKSRNVVGFTGTQKQPVQEAERPFVEASRNQQPSRDFCADDGHCDSGGSVWAHESHSTNGIFSSIVRAKSATTFPDRASRPPSFTTYRSDSVPSGIPGSSQGSFLPFDTHGVSVTSESHYPTHFLAVSNGGKAVLSGLDMLAAVTTHGAFASLLESSPMTNTSASVPLGTAPNSTGQHYQQAQPIVDPLPSLGSMQRFGLQSPSIRNTPPIVARQ